MHLKNWSLIYADGRTPTLSPAYDLLSTIPYIADESMALKYSRTKKMTDFSKDELTHLAAKAKISESLVLNAASETVTRFKQIWSEQKTKLPLEKRIAGIPYKAGNRHERRKLVARARSAYMRDKRKEAEFEKDFRIADRVERRQNASHQRALARKAASKNSK